MGLRCSEVLQVVFGMSTQIFPMFAKNGHDWKIQPNSDLNETGFQYNLITLAS